MSQSKDRKAPAHHPGDSDTRDRTSEGNQLCLLRTDGSPATEHTSDLPIFHSLFPWMDMKHHKAYVHRRPTAWLLRLRSLRDREPKPGLRVRSQQLLLLRQTDRQTRSRVGLRQENAARSRGSSPLLACPSRWHTVGRTSAGRLPPAFPVPRS